MREPSRMTPWLRVVTLVGLLVMMLGLAAVVGRPRLASSEIPLGPLRVYARDDPNGLGGIEVALPARWGVESVRTNAVRGGVLVRATEDGSAPRPLTNLAVVGPRVLTIEVYPQMSVLPPRTFLEERLGIRQQVERGTMSGHAAVLTGVAYNTAGAVPEETEGRGVDGGWAFELMAAATMPSGRVLLVRLKGPGRGSRGDALVLRRVMDSVQVGESASVAGLGADALDRLRSRPVTSPVGLLAEWAAGREVSGPKLKQVAVVALAGDNVTLELFPVYLPPASTGGSAEGGAEGGEVGGEVAAAQAMAGMHDARLLGAEVRTLSAGRLLLLPRAEVDGGSAARRAQVAALVVYPDNPSLAPLAALLVARGETDGRTDLSRQLNRAADRLVFAQHSDDLPQMLLAGRHLAGMAVANQAGDEIVPLFPANGPSSEARPEVLMRISGDGTVDVRREGLSPQRLLRTERKGPGRTLSVSVVRQVQVGGTYADVLSRQFAVTLGGGEAEESPESDLLSPGRYVRGHELFARAGRVGSGPTLVVTDTIAPLDLDTEALFSLVLMQPFDGPREPRRVALHALGSGRVVVAEYGPGGELLGMVEPGRLETRREGRGGVRRGVELWREEGG